MRYRARCPFCGARLSPSEFFHSGQRRCGCCDALIMPEPRLNNITNLIAGVTVAGMILAMVGLIVLLSPSNSIALAVTLVGLALIAWITAVVGRYYFPFVTPFVPAPTPPRLCEQCGY